MKLKLKYVELLYINIEVIVITKCLINIKRTTILLLIIILVYIFKEGVITNLWNVI
jgi:hypothetical protein